MASLSTTLLFLSFCFSLLFFSSFSQEDPQKTYIVYMGSHPKGKVSTSSHHIRFLTETIGSNFAPRSLIRSYKRSFNGFVAKLTEAEAKKVSEMEGVISVFPNGKKQLHTTRSWDFMGFSEQVKRIPAVESNIIVGVFDSGIWPESPSFDDTGYGPPPAKWRGRCEASANFSCNNKIIGARSYRSNGKHLENDIKGPIDSDGHGTHTASTVAGGLVRQASMLGLGLGTARGGVPSARIAAYKVCWSDGCTDADILAAFDDAIADGVDIISGSLGGSSVKDYFNDSIAIGSFHAMKKGILTTLAVGNNGPEFTTIVNFSPWSLSVAASTTDRKFETKVKLGDGREFNGVSVNTFDLNGTQIPLVYAGDIPKAPFDRSVSRMCFENTVDKERVKGKIVVCDSLAVPGGVVAVEGAAGIIMQDESPQDDTNSYPLPASHVGPKPGALILSYINSTRVPTASIMKSRGRKRNRAPFVASFSSRGPNPITPNILKPDISGPGVEILAAWPSTVSPSGAEEDNKRVVYNVISGTSMACPHVTAAAAYVKSFHPTWSPAALKSALITTAFPMSPKRNPDGELAYGAGHINPLGAVHPGLIYNASETDYVKFLCGQGYSTESLRRLSDDSASCSANNSGTVFELNYPSFALSTNASNPISQVFRRRVTNVGSSYATSYKAVIVNPWRDLKITVKPSVLLFKRLGEELRFEVRIGGKIRKGIESAALVWDDGKHKVRSPITVFNANLHSLD
ncbi:cucumisin-like [Cucurbita pepo subsp. pepo]|uniref:cucumisin-like n=1 Tax=Cucurbita pepo subsp. pepo TaxID=3664 RepID=UPI000C9D484F|nr:cucumisin-like [Cucurbita pepo subsp. pepo]